MADAISDEVRRLTVQTVTAYLQATGSQLRCPFCGSSGWEMVEPATAGVGNIAIATGPIALGQKVMSQVLLTCGQCAFVRAHSARKIAEWSLTQKNAGPK